MVTVGSKETAFHQEAQETRSPMDDLREGARHEIEDLIELELVMEAMTEEKAALLRSYLQEDAHQLGTFWSELKNELGFLELLAGQWILTAADPTRLDWIELDRRLKQSQLKPASGEFQG